MPIEKLRPSFTFTEDRLEDLRQVVPEAFADGKINWDSLQQALGNYLEEEDEAAEHFGLTWPGKREARRLASLPSQGTLVPQPSLGVNEDSTHNLFIEADNLEALKLMLKSYAGRVKMIYIDPPYNTGKDRLYKDDFTEPLDSYLKRSRVIDEDGLMLTTNTKAGGRFHTNWMSMIYPRLRIAREFLTPDGVMFVSIDDHELHHLLVILNELFGEENFLGTFIWVNEGNIDNQNKIKQNHEYVVCYARNITLFPAPPVIDPNIPTSSKLYRDVIENTIVKNGPKNPPAAITIPIGFPVDFEEGIIEPSPNVWPRLSQSVTVSNYKTQNGVVATSGWSSRDIFERFIRNGFRQVKDTKDQETTFYFTQTGAIFNRKVRDESQSHVLTVLYGMGTVQGANSQLLDMGLMYEYPKPVELLKYLIEIGVEEKAIVMDFFAGACPIAESVFAINNKNHMNLSFICVQLPESVDAESIEGKNALEQNLHTLADIGKERIRRVIDKLQAENEGKLDLNPEEDLGFKCFKLERSHFKDWQNYEGDSEGLQLRLDAMENPLVDGWQPEALLTEIMLLEGFPLDSRIRDLPAFTHNTVQRVSSDFCDHSLVVCLDAHLHADTLTVLDLDEKDVFVCLDSALDDEAKLRLADQCHLKVI